MVVVVVVSSFVIHACSFAIHTHHCIALLCGHHCPHHHHVDHHNADYTDHRICCLLPELGPIIGYAVTAEVTTNDADSVALPWEDYYGQIDAIDGRMENRGKKRITRTQGLLL